MFALKLWGWECGLHIDELVMERREKALRMELCIVVVIEYQFIIPHYIGGRRGGSRSKDCVMRCNQLYANNRTEC